MCNSTSQKAQILNNIFHLSYVTFSELILKAVRLVSVFNLAVVLALYCDQLSVSRMSWNWLQTLCHDASKPNRSLTETLCNTLKEISRLKGEKVCLLLLFILFENKCYYCHLNNVLSKFKNT